MSSTARARRTGLPAGLAALMLLTGLVPAASLAPVLAASPNIVISQVYGGGGNAGAQYTNDFVELFNRGTTTVNVTGWSVQYASATGTGNFGGNPVTVLSGSLAAGQSYLVQQASGGAVGVPLPTPDATGTVNMSGTAGKVIVVNVSSGLACNGGSTACDATQLSQIVDLVGYGTANFFEGAAAPGLSNTTSASRINGGCTDTDNNAGDFTAGAPNPHNSASPLSPCGASTDPTGVGAANPAAVAAGGSTLLTVSVTPGTNPTSTGLAVVADLTSIGGSATQAFFDNGTNGDVTPSDNIFSYNATVSGATTPGGKTLPATISDAQVRSGSTSIGLTVTGGPAPVVISEVYGGGGNAGAFWTNDFIELYNRTGAPISLAGWSVQYASSAGTTWQVTALGGSIPAGRNYLVQESAGAGGVMPLPSPDALGTIAMSGTAGKVALVSSTSALTGSCPTGGAIIDFVGYGTAANCFEGSGPTGTLSNTTSALRNGGGATDTNDNAADFTVGTPDPHASADQAPSVTASQPTNGGSHNAAADLSVTFSEPVNVAGTWFTITCSTSGSHTAAVTGGPITFTINPDVNFSPAESCLLTILAANVTDQDADDPPDNMAANFSATFSITGDCGDPVTRIHAIQGSSTASPLVGLLVEVEAIVVGDFQDSTSFNGFNLQEADTLTDADPATSEGLFVFEGGSAVDVAVGDRVRVAGTVAEFSDLTELTNVGSVVVCSTGNALPSAAAVTMPFATSTFAERYEGMLTSFAQTLTVTEVFTLARFGEAVLSSGGRLTQPTEVAAPGAPAQALQAANDRNRLVLDDGDNLQNIDPTLYPQGGLSASNTLRVGDTLPGGNTFVFDQRFGAYRLQPIAPVAFNHSNPRPAAPAAVGGNLRVGSFNVLNFFNGDGLGGGFPTSRGAETAFELSRQTAKIVAAITALNADIVGLMEIENDAGPNSAIADLVAALNAATAPGTYAYIDTGVIGTDEIKVALIYKPAAVSPAGTWTILTSAVDPRFIDTLNRPALAQTFDTVAGGRLTVVVNHLKSKGSACDAVGDPDTGDGSGNCNVTRTNAARALVDWLATDPTGSGDRDVLLLGDYNAYAMEDPISVLRAAGYTDLGKAFGGAGSYSYVFQGQSGTLDHALASPTLTAQVTGATEWHINPDEPIGLDYNVNFKTANQVTTFYAPDAYRSSDHDPALVGINLLAYHFGGFQAPLFNPPTVNLANGGSSLPLKFSLGGNQGPAIFFVALWSRQADCSSWAPIGGAETAAVAGSSGLQYDAATDTYTFVWKTKKTWAGTCRTLTMELADGTVRTLRAQFS